MEEQSTELAGKILDLIVVEGFFLNAIMLFEYFFIYIFLVSPEEKTEEITADFQRKIKEESSQRR